MESHQSIVKQLRKIFAENSDKRICVVGVSCIGKTTLLRDLPECLDGDSVVWSRLPMDIYEKLAIAKTPWNKVPLSIWTEWYIKTDFDIKPGRPVFSVWVEDCDLIVYLTLSESEYIERVTKRGRNVKKMLGKRLELENVVAESKMPTVVVDMSSTST